jgi:hypothetical protein
LTRKHPYKEEAGYEKYIYEWDSRHGLVEKYDKRGNHLGEFNPVTGEKINPRVASRRIIV